MERSALRKDISKRTQRFQTLLQQQNIDGAFILQKVALYYFTGTDQDAHLWVPASDIPLLLVRKSLDRAFQDGLLKKIIPLSSYKDLPERMTAHSGRIPQRLGLELDVLPVNLFRIYENLFPRTEFVDISPLLKQVRMVKSNYELEIIKRAAALGDRLFRNLPRFLLDSESEADLAIKAEGFYRREGHTGLIRTRGFNLETFYGHIMAGRNSALPSATPGPTGGFGEGPFSSQGAGRVKIESHAPILVDYASNVDGYLSDQARIFSKGMLPEKFKRAHRVMIEIQEILAQTARPGSIALDLYDLALKIAQKAGLGEGFMGHPQPVPFVGHGLGLELDEWPVIGRGSEQVLENGVVLALEPKVVFPGEGVAGLENTFMVRPDGLEKLNRFPDDIISLP